MPNAWPDRDNSAFLGWTAEQAGFRETAARFAHEYLAPRYKTTEAAKAIPMETRRRMGELGLIGVEFPERFGGLGTDHVSSGIVLEAIAEGDFNVGYIPLLASLCGAIVARHAAPEIAADILPRVASGASTIALALTEPSGGSEIGRAHV